MHKVMKIGYVVKELANSATNEYDGRKNPHITSTRGRPYRVSGDPFWESVRTPALESILEFGFSVHGHSYILDGRVAERLTQEEYADILPDDLYDAIFLDKSQGAGYTNPYTGTKIIANSENKIIDFILQADDDEAYAKQHLCSDCKDISKSKSIPIVKYGGYVVQLGGGRAFSGGDDFIDGEIIDVGDRESLPENAQKSYDAYQAGGWKGNVAGQSPGTKAGGTYNNVPPTLPQKDSNGNPITYREFDVNDKAAGQGRDAERFVVGNDGSVFYTNDHYNTFTLINE